MMEDVRGLMYVGSLVFEHELNELLRLAVLMWA
jgi:hypothetical protein